MLTSAVRVLARVAALQLEETAGQAARPVADAILRRNNNSSPAELHAGQQLQADQAIPQVNDSVRISTQTSTLPPKMSDALLYPKTLQPSAKSSEHSSPNTSELAKPGPQGDDTMDARLPLASSIKEASPPSVSPRDTSFEAGPSFVKKKPTPYIDRRTANDVEKVIPSTEQPSSTTVISDSPVDKLSASLDTQDILGSSNEQAVASGRSEAVVDQEDDDPPVLLRASRVPSSRIGRLFHYGSLAASLSLGAASESIRRSTTGGEKPTGSVFMSDANVRRLVATLGKMRGAALKLGQFMSIQDNNMLPPEIEKVLHQVQAHANYMPDWQMEQVLSAELGSEWQSLFTTFDRTPIASASIGQVHRATLASTQTPVAVKIQFPGISQSINSDLNNLSLLLRSSALLPKGLYLQNTIATMRRELEDECDYVREGDAGRRFGEYLKGDDYFVVPRVIEEATSEKVLTTEWMSGKPLSRVKNLSQETRDKIGKNILRLCLIELFQFRFMQTDPNWANFLYDSKKDQIQLIDFGASREYTKGFMDSWFELLNAALVGDKVRMKEESLKIGYLTGDENEEMLDAHLKSMVLVASPFAHEGTYEFANQTITDSVRALIPIMLKYRLTPPPPETYSLNRKLSGAFLMCAKLEARVDCKKLWEDHAAGYQVG